MDSFVATDSQDAGAQDLVRLRIDHDLHEAVGLAFLDRAAYARHWALSDEGRTAGLPHFRLSHAGSAERRVDVNRVSPVAVAHPARIVVQKIGCHDLEI